MPNDILSLSSSSRQLEEVVRGGSELCRRARGLLLAMACALLPGCGETDNGVTYGDDVGRLFNRRCTTCHRPGTPIGVDIQNPFAPETGLVTSRNSWYDVYEGETPELNVVPFEPENSFLMDKLIGESALPPDPDGPGPEGPHGGAPMPLQIAPLTPEEIAAFETWVAQGALNDASFAPVRQIIGDEARIGGKCIFCHYEGTPNPPNLTDPFGREGLVNVPAIYRADMVRVLPGDPERSLLIQKIRLDAPDSIYGAQMPYSYNPLTSREIEIVRQWILEGARP